MLRKGYILKYLLLSCFAVGHAHCSSSDGAVGETDGGHAGDTGGEFEIGVTEFSVKAEISDAVSTVGIVEWSAKLDNIDSADIAFGPDTDYGRVAPVDLTEKKYRTLLLGMKPSSTYHFRVSAIVGNTRYSSEDYTIDTGPVINDLPETTVDNRNAENLEPGFVVSNFISDSTVFITDADGDYVWWYKTDVEEATRARMTYDGKFMLVGSNNVADDGSGEIVKISMDGRDVTSINAPDLHHDFTVLPDDSIAFIEYDKNGEGLCDRIVEIDEDGARRTVYSLREDFEHLAVSHEWCHSNALHHNEKEDAYYMSVLDLNSIVKIDRATGSLVWVLGGGEDDFDSPEWRKQHGHHVLEDGILIFNNAGNMWTNLSLAIELSLDEDAFSAKKVWAYEGGPISLYQGDVQRLPGGNTLVIYSSAGVWHEVDSDGNLLREMSWPVGGVTGYAMWRPSLYGPPVK